MTASKVRLYKVLLHGPTQKPNFVVATGLNHAWSAVENFFDKEGYGLSKDKEFHSVELIAKNYLETASPGILFMALENNK